jgi:Flp pilus assembly protein TadD
VDAIGTLEAAIELRPQHAPLHNRLALAMAMAGRPEQAAEVYRRALDVDPGVAFLPDNLLLILEQAGKADLAAEIRRMVGE